MSFDEEKSDFPCPMCRESTPAPQQDKPRDKWAKLFPKNRLLMSLFEGELQRSEVCRLHPGKVVEFYCESHIDIGCSTCFITRHKGCDLVPLETYIKSGKFKRSCQKNNDMLQQFKKIFEDLIVDAGSNLDNLEKDKNKLIDDVHEMKNSLVSMLNELEQKMIELIDETYKQECTALCETTSRCRKVVADINNSVEQVAAAADRGINMVQRAEMIVSVEEKMSGFGKTIRDENDNFRVVSMGMSFDPLIEDLKQGLEQFGNVFVDRKTKERPLPGFIPKTSEKKEDEEHSKRHRNKHVVRVGEYSVSGESESFFCNITSTVLLPDGRIILADDSNSKLKMMNPRFKVIFEMQLDSNPLNLAKVSDTEIAVTLPGKREVVFIEVGLERLSINRKIKTRLDCWGVDILENFVVVTTGRDGHSVIVLDMKGKEMNSFLLTTHADENIRCPVSVFAHTKTRLLYITCTGGAWSKGCVICTDLNGKVEKVYSDPDIDTPRSAAMDRHGKLYICGLESSTVYQINEKGDTYKIFPAKNEQLVGPLHINFIKHYYIRFLLTEVASDTLKVYELPTTK